MNNFLKTSFLIALCFFTQNVFAFNLEIKNSTPNVTVGSDFYIDIFLDTQGKNINGIQGSIIFDKTKVNFLRTETGKSFVTNWVEMPHLIDNEIIFSGITPNGFTEFTDLNTGQKSNGNILRLVFNALKEGDFSINTKNISVTANDGDGSLANVNDISFSQKISNSGEINSYSSEEKIKPELIAYIVKDPNLFDGQYTLVFNAIDKGSGIEGVYIKKSGSWQKIESPYLLDSKERKGIINIKAIDFAGNFDTKMFVLPAYGNVFKYIIILSLLLVLFLVLKLYRKYYANKKI